MESVGKLLHVDKHQQTSQQKASLGSEKNLRLLIIKAAITKTYLACNLQEPNENGMKAKTAVFIEDLTDIPTQELDAVFRLSRQRKAGFYPSTGELLLAWKDIKADNERNKESQDRNEQKALPKPFDPELVAKFKTIPLLAPRERIKEYEALHIKYPLAGYDKEAERERCRLNMP